MKRAVLILGFLFCASPTLATITLVQSSSQTESGAQTRTCTLNSVVAGNALIVTAGQWRGSAISGKPTVSDGANTYTEAFSTDAGAQHSKGIIWSAPNVAGGTTTITVTAADTGASDLDVACYEYSGLITTALLDQANGSFVSGYTSPNDQTTGNITTTNANDLLFAFAWNASSGTIPSTTGASFNSRQGTSNPDGEASRGADRIVSATGTYNNTFQVSVNVTNFHVMIASFKGVASGSSASTIGGPSTMGGPTIRQK